MPISTSGIGSGIDIRELVDKLVKSEGEVKKLKYDSEEAAALSKITAYGTLKSELSEFDEKLFYLQNNNPFDAKKTHITTYQGNTVVNATATYEATPGDYTLEVTQLALSQKLGSISFPESYTQIGTGQLTFTRGEGTWTFDITDENSTLEGIANTINAASENTGISANLITSNTGTTIVFSSDTGLNNIFTVNVENDHGSGLARLDSDNLTVLQAAKNAMVRIEGVSVISDSNTIEYAIKGVTLDLVSYNIGYPVTLTISDDIEGATKAITDFVEKYNTIFNSITKLTKAGAGDRKTAGVLVGDSTLRNLQFQMKRVLNNIASSLPSGFQTLSQIGITSNELTGLLVINSEKLSTALEKNFNAVGDLFLDPQQGIVQNMEQLVKDYVEINGFIQNKTDGLNKTIIGIKENQIALEQHLIQLEKRLLTRFIAMDIIVAKLKSVSEFLTIQLDNLPKPLSTH